MRPGGFGSGELHGAALILAPALVISGASPPRLRRPRGLPACAGDAGSWLGALGACGGYSAGPAGRDRCLQDEDGAGLRAHAVCPQCGLCAPRDAALPPYRGADPGTGSEAAGPPRPAVQRALQSGPSGRACWNVGDRVRLSPSAWYPEVGACATVMERTCEGGREKAVAFDNGDQYYLGYNDLLECEGCLVESVQVSVGLYPEEVSWEIIDRGDGATICSGTAEEYAYPCCLGPGQFEVACYDSYGDGWGLGSFLQVDGVKYCDYFYSPFYSDEMRQEFYIGEPSPEPTVTPTPAPTPGSAAGGGSDIAGGDFDIELVALALLCLFAIIALVVGVFYVARTAYRALLRGGCPAGTTCTGAEKVPAVKALEEERPGFRERTSTKDFPQYWTNSNTFNDDTFDQMVYVDRSSHDHFQRLLRASYRARATQDRPCPRGTCARTPGGCPCNKPGGDPGLPADYRVRTVVRVEDSEMWARYVKKRASLKSKRASDSPLPAFDPPIFTGDVSACAGAFEPLDAAVNEAYLWHGTSVRRALSIAQDDFRIDTAGAGMYGPGAYLAESSTKADEYARDEPGDYYDGVFALLLCRVSMGKFYYTTQRDTAAAGKVSKGDFDSTCGDRLKAADTFREFVVYDADQLYPEYVVLYSRVHKGDDPAEVARSIERPLHMQVPVNWRNVHRNPTRAEEAFHEQYRVGNATLLLLQKLVEASRSDGTPRLQVLRARRVESSDVWNQYSEFKRLLRNRLADPGSAYSGGSAPRFALASELDPTDDRVSAQLRLESEAAQQAMSTSDLDGALNERLLWCGTSQEASEAAAVAEQCHGERFGSGAYFAEDIGKSLSYARAASDGRKFIMLCRVLCGDMHYTEKAEDKEAGRERQSLGKDSVLARPWGSALWPREFVVDGPSQVYAEYVLEISEEGAQRV